MLNRIKGILYNQVSFLAQLGGRKPATRKVLIIRTDEIGDFMLWRPFLPEIVQYYKNRNYTIHFLGNASWKNIFELQVDEDIQQIIWMDKIVFKKSLPYRYRLLKKIYTASYETVINPIYSRDIRNDDAFVRVAKANSRIGMIANQESVKPYEVGYDKGLYTSLFDHPQKPLFEFYRNKLFTEFITKKNSNVSNTLIKKSILPNIQFSIPLTYFVVFPGSRNKQRIWPTNFFIEVSDFLFKKFQLTAVLCGATGDLPYTSYFEKNYPHPVINLTGKTSLSQMLSLLSNASCLLSVDTGAVHLAAAVECTVFGVFNGSQYKRFAPYPIEINKRFFAAYPNEIEEELANDELVKHKYEFVTRTPYHLISPKKIINLIQTHLYR